MERRIKRSSSDDTFYHSDIKKKLKLLTTKSCLESLPNEILLEIFEYVDMNDIYLGFFDLNNRFGSLLINFQIVFQNDLSKVSKSQFDVYNKNVFQENKDRIKILRLSNSFTIDKIFSPIRLICHLINLEKLIFDHIHSQYLHEILQCLIDLPKLHSLIISPIDSISNPNVLFMEIFRLKHLKSCQLTYRMKMNEIVLPIDFELTEQSPITYLTINGPFRYESFQNLFIYLPKLRHLSINYLFGSNRDFPINFSPIELKDLKYVSLNLHYSIDFDQFTKLIENFFRHIEVLRLPTFLTYTFAEQWEKLISSFLPNLRVFDIQDIYTDDISYHFYKYISTNDDFQSKFWKEKQWFFHHQYSYDNYMGSSPSGIFYSTNPYRKHQMFHWQFDHEISGWMENYDFKIVKHLHICSESAARIFGIYFPNVTELTVKNNYDVIYFELMPTVFGRILPLKQLKKLNINSTNFPVDQVLYLLSLTPNLRSLKCSFQWIYHYRLKSVERSEIYQSISKTNQVKNLQICHCCSLDEIQFFIHLFPQIESLQIEIMEKEIIEITRCILTEMDHLFFFHITNIIEAYLQRFNLLIKSENLLDNYLIQFIDQDIYLWW